MPKRVGYIFLWVPQNRVIDYACHSWDTNSNVIESSRVSISRCVETHWCPAVSVPPPFSDESCRFSGIFRQRQAMIAVPCVKDRFSCVCRNRRYQIKRARCVVRFSQRCFVELLQVHGSTRSAVFFSCNNHAGTPFCWGTLGYRLNNSQSYISVNV